MNNLIGLRLSYFKEIHKDMDEKNEEVLKKEIEKYFNEHLNKDCFGAVVYEHNRPVSCALMNILSKAPSPKCMNGLYGEIYGVYTLPDYRNKGYSYNCIELLKQVAKEKNLGYITLDSSYKGKSVYEKSGFQLDTDSVGMKIIVDEFEISGDVEEMREFLKNPVRRHHNQKGKVKLFSFPFKNKKNDSVKNKDV